MQMETPLRLNTGSIVSRCGVNGLSEWTRGKFEFCLRAFRPDNRNSRLSLGDKGHINASKHACTHASIRVFRVSVFVCERSHAC